MEEIALLGGGISALSFGYSLKKNNQKAVLFEKEGRLGGALSSFKMGSHLFERGPRTFKYSRCPHLYALCQELGLELAYTDLLPHKLLFKGKPRSFKYLCIKMVWPILSEWTRKKGNSGDESVRSFVSRRLGSGFAEIFFDPLVRGIYCGSIDDLSALTLFKKLKKWEEEYGSLTKGFLSSKKEKKKKDFLFLPKKGTSGLVEALEKEFPGTIHKGETVKSLSFKEDYWKITTDKGEYFSKKIVSALPSFVIGKLLKTDFPELAKKLSEIRYGGVTVVNLGYERDLFSSDKIYGYLVPSIEKEMVLGVVFDSNAFPFMGHQVSVMVSLEEKNPIEVAKKALEKHMGIKEAPLLEQASSWNLAIALVDVGHEKRTNEIRELLKEIPTLELLGNYLTGASVEACIKAF